MIKLIEVIQEKDAKQLNCGASIKLPIELRIKSRVRVALDDGRAAGLMLPRGGLIRGGDVLKSEDGLLVKVIAAPQIVSTVSSDDPLMLMKAAYHLGNRHIALQIEKKFVRYLHDHILDDMIRGLGIEVLVSEEAFEPEAGAYQQMGGGHSHGDAEQHQHHNIRPNHHAH
jgi:urease accessory protein